MACNPRRVMKLIQTYINEEKMFVLLAVLNSEGDPHIYLTVPLYDYQVSFDLCDSKE